MKKEMINKSEIKLIGITVRTNNKNEMDPQTSKIGELVGHYFGQNIAAQIPNHANPGVTLSVYTDYDSNEHADYTYFIGEEVSSFDNIPSNLEKITIPATKYAKFTTPVGKMPEVVINAWQEIWKMRSSDLGGDRAYIADYELYDQRAMDPANTSLDIYIGVN